MNIIFLIGLFASTAVVAELRHRFEIEVPKKGPKEESEDAEMLTA